jgi:hypothetical protein
MTASNTYGRTLVLALVNKSGAGVVLGDVVIIDTANAGAFTTTTSGASPAIVGVAQETIANNGTGRVMLQGYTSLLNVNASVTLGHYGQTHTVAKQASDAGASRQAGTFCQFLTAGATPDAMIWPTDLGGGSGAPTTADYLTGTSQGGLSAEIVVGATPGGELGGTWASPTIDTLPFGTYKRAAGNYTTTSGTFVDVDGTNLAITKTTGARVVLIIFSAETGNSSSNQANYFDVDVDGARIGGDFGLIGVQLYTAGATGNASFVVPKLMSAGSHTFKLQWLRTSGTATLYGAASGSSQLVFSVVELYAA